MFKNVALIVLSFIYTLNAQNDSIYFVRSGSIIHQESLNLIDSIIFMRPEHYQYGTFTDPRDHQTYPTVLIGTQEWMAANLAYLPSVNASTSQSSSIPYYYVAQYTGTDPVEARNSINFSKYGVLYNFTAAITACPTGWHLPDTSEYSTLINHFGDWTIAGGKLKETGYTYWNSPNISATNESGFSARAGGEYTAQTDGFRNVGKFGQYWSSTREGSIVANSYCIHYNSPMIVKSIYFLEYGFSVRCIRNQ